MVRAGFVVLFNFIVPRILNIEQWSRNRELPILFAIVIAAGSAYIAHEVGFSPALGAFIEANASNSYYDVRKNGSGRSSPDPGSNTVDQMAWAMVECDGSEIVEGKREGSGILFFELGTVDTPAGGANPHGPFGHPLYGPFGGPL